MLRRLTLLSGLLLAITATGLFAGMAVYIWRVKAEVERQTEYLSSRADAAGDAAEHAIRFVKQVLDRAEADLATARAEVQRQPPSQPVGPIPLLAALQASQQLAGSIQRAQGAVEVATDAVVIADAVLDVVGDYPQLKSLFGVDQSQVDTTRVMLLSVAEELRQARSLLGVPLDAGIFSAEQLNAIDAAIRQTRWYAEEMHEVVRGARQRINEIRERIELLARRLTYGITTLCLLGATGQLFLARFCIRRLVGLPA